MKNIGKFSNSIELNNLYKANKINIIGIDNKKKRSKIIGVSDSYLNLSKLPGYENIYIIDILNDDLKTYTTKIITDDDVNENHFIELYTPNGFKLNRSYVSITVLGSNIKLYDGKNFINRLRSNTEIKINIDKLDTSNVTDFSNFISDIHTPSQVTTTIKLPDITCSNKVTSVKFMFSEIPNLSILDIRNFYIPEELEGYINISGMFIKSFSGTVGQVKPPIIICNQLFKDWCIKHREEINLDSRVQFEVV